MKSIARPTAKPQARPVSSSRQAFRRISAMLGPGLITGAADDDPSAIGTYAVVGAQFGTALLWTAVVTWPLIALVQFVCARIGILSGGGLAQALARKFPQPIVVTLALALL